MAASEARQPLLPARRDDDRTGTAYLERLSGLESALAVLLDHPDVDVEDLLSAAKRARFAEVEATFEELKRATAEPPAEPTQATCVWWVGSELGEFAVHSDRGCRSL